jgi:mono/diheme cytochrome c family protein
MNHLKRLSPWLFAAALGAALLSSACSNAGTASPAPSNGQPVAEVTSAARELESRTDSDESDHDRVMYFESIFDRLRDVPQLAPLFDQYRVPAPTQYDDDHEVDGLRALLRAVRITIQSGTVTITNRQTGGVIFTAPLRDLSSGVFHPENMPGGTTPPPPATCSSFTYSAWSTCSNGVQTRTVLTSSPTGCTGGTPVLSQACTVTPPPPPACTYTTGAWGACQSSGTQTRTVTASPAGCVGTPPASSQTCTYVPPVLDGATLYAQSCAGCHGPLASSNLQGKNISVSSIKSRNMTQGLTDAQLQAIVTAVNGTTPPPPATCSSFTYSAWGACQSNNTQTRTVLTSSPAGCTGGTPVLSQACTYVPPVTTCSSFTYSAWGACQSNNTQTRTVLTSSPTGCTGGTPVLSQACTYVPPVTTCSSFTYSAWGACQSNNTQTRTVLTSSPTGCTGGTPVLSQACTYVPPVTTCTSFTYSAWGACQSNNTQTRTVLTSSPTGCTGGTPVLSQSCTYTPPLDGAALYGQSCAGCHGPLATSNLKGKNISVSSIKSRNMTQGLTDAQLQAIVTAVGP